MNRLLFKIYMLVAVLLVNNAAAGLFGAQEFWLENGLHVVVVENHRVPIVKHMLWYKSGSADEKLGKGGSAHLLEHLMFRGTKNVKGQEFNRLMEANGAESNAFTGQDMTAYHQFLDISRLELAMFLEADRMQNLQISDEDFALERDIVFEERKQRIDNNPLGKFREVLAKALWQEHPYSQPVIGMENEIIELNKEDVLKYYKQHYNPSNAVLVLVGDIDIKTAKKLAEKYYGSIPKTKVEKENNFVELADGFKAHIDMSEPNVKGYRIWKNFAASSYTQNKENLYNLLILAEYMGGGDTSKLYKKLVLEKKIAVSVDVAYNPAARSYGQFSVSVVPSEGVEPEEVLQELELAWNEALRELNTDELELTKQKMLAGLIYLKDNPDNAAYIIGSMIVSGANLQEVEEYENELRKVRYTDVKKIADILWNNNPQVVGILRPKGEING